MSRAAQAVATAVREMKVTPRSFAVRRVAVDDFEMDPGPSAIPAPAAAAGEGAGDMATTLVRKRKRKTAAVPRGARKGASAPRVQATASDLAGLKQKPKNKILFLNTDVALRIVRRALDAMDFADQDEAREKARLLARIDARA